MPEIKVSAGLWSTSLFPEGLIERWLRPDGSLVEAGTPIATIRIEDALHELMAPAGGRLIRGAKTGSIVDPGMVIGRVIS